MPRRNSPIDKGDYRTFYRNKLIIYFKKYWEPYIRHTRSVKNLLKELYEQIEPSPFETDEQMVCAENRAFRKIKAIRNERIRRKKFFANVHVAQFKFEKEKRCVICFENCKDGDNMAQLSECEHEFHYGCLIDWLDLAPVRKGKCPLCRMKIFF